MRHKSITTSNEPAGKSSTQSRRLWFPVAKSLRLQLISAILLSTVLAVIVFVMISHVRVSIGNGIDEEVAHANAVALGLMSHVTDPMDTDANRDYIQRLADYYDIRVAIVKEDGTVVGHSANFTDSHVDLGQLRSIFSGSYQGGPFYYLTPFRPGSKEFFILTIGQPQVKLLVAYGGDVTLALACSFTAFMILFLALIRPKLRYIEQLAAGVRELASGDLNLSVRVKGHDELALLAQNLNHTTDQLQQMIETERRIEQAKSELITNLSHDLRTPLTTIMGYLRLLMDGRYEDEQQHKRYMDITYAQAERLKFLIDSLFEYTVLTSGSSQDLSLSQVNLTELVGQLAEEWVPVCAENQLELACHLQPLALTAEIDPNKMVRALENILSNAVRYSPKPGAVQMSLDHIFNEVRLTIKNQAEPISNEDLAKIFDRFYRLDEARSSTTGGSGLGLAIAKSIIEIHGGKVWAEYEDGWISFIVQIPCVKEVRT